MTRAEFYPKMTSRQVDIALNHFNSTNALANYIDAVNKAIEAYEAIVSLPHTNEVGTSVTHGCNLIMFNIRDHWLGIAKAQWGVLNQVDHEEAERVRPLMLRAQGIKQ